MDFAQTLGLMLTGVLAVPILQVLKRYLKLSGPAMLWTAYVTSIVLAVGVAVLTGQASLSAVISDPTLVFGGGGIVMSIATAIYGSIKKQMNLGA